MNFWMRGRSAIARGLNVDLTHSQKHYARILERYVKSGMDWLEVGCGRHIVPDWAMPIESQREMAGRCSRLIGVDADGAILEHPLLSSRVMALGGTLPFRNQSFDLVTSNMVVEHVPEATPFLLDIARVLKPGGRYLFHTPNFRYYLIFIASLVPDAVKQKLVWWLERRQESDVFHTFYRLNTREQIQSAAGSAGFEVEAIHTITSSGIFSALGPIGWAECLILKAQTVLFNGKYNSNFVVVLKKR